MRTLLLAAVAIIGAAASAASTGQPLMRTVWGQRWGYAQDAPLWPSNCSSWTPPCPRDAGPNVRLGCESTAIAQIMFYHRRCPTGAVNYAAAGFPNATMNYTAEAATLCDWPSFALAPPNISGDPTVQKVYIYCMFRPATAQRMRCDVIRCVVCL
jgi:hypothetical protein